MGNASASPIAANLLLTGAVATTNALCDTLKDLTPTCPVTSTQYPGGAVTTGTYVLGGELGSGSGTIAFPIATTPPTTQPYAIYGVDSSGCGRNTVLCAITSFFMIDENSSNRNPAIIFAKE